ncbi:MAG: hypothetical protein Q8Q39_02740 [bacterium]|nr:hypothetical protein [bacterium]
MTRTCLAIVENLFAAASYPQLGGVVTEVNGNYPITNRCPNTPVPEEDHCLSHRGSTQKFDVPSRVSIEIQFELRAKSVWERFTKIQTAGTAVYNTQQCADIRAIRLDHPTFRPHPPVLKAKLVDTATLVALLESRFGYIYEIRTGVRQKQGYDPIHYAQILFARHGHFHIGPAAVSVVARELIEDQLMRPADLRVYRNPGFVRSDGKWSCLHAVEIYHSHDARVDPKLTIEFDGGLWDARSKSATRVTGTGAATVDVATLPSVTLGDNAEAAKTLTAVRERL